MDPGLRRAWTKIVTTDDYEVHMASIGQAQAAAELTAWLIAWQPCPLTAVLRLPGPGPGRYSIS